MLRRLFNCLEHSRAIQGELRLNVTSSIHLNLFSSLPPPESFVLLPSIVLCRYLALFIDFQSVKRIMSTCRTHKPIEASTFFLYNNHRKNIKILLLKVESCEFHHLIVDLL